MDNDEPAADDPKRFHFKVGTPPAGMKTFAEWLAWRESEDRRLETERQAFYERRAAATYAAIERDLAGATQH